MHEGAITRSKINVLKFLSLTIQEDEVSTPRSLPRPSTQKSLTPHLYLQSTLLILDMSNDDGGGILGNDFVVVQHFEF